MADGTVNTRFRFIADTKKAVNQLNSQGKKIQKNLGAINKQADKTKKGIGRLGGGMVSTAFQFGFAAAIAGAAFNQLRQVIEQTVTEGAEGIDKMTRAIFQSGVEINNTTQANIDKFDEFRNFILDMGTGKTIFGINQVADAVKEVGKAVQDPANTIPLATEALKLMTIEEVDAAVAAQGLVKIFKLYKDEISSVSDITDVLVAVNQQSSITLDQLIRSFKFAAQGGKTFGQSLSETGAFLGILNEQVGTAGGGPGRAYRALLSELTDSSTLLSKGLRDLGINLVDQNGSFRDLVDIAADYRKALNEAGENDVLKAQILELADAGRQGEAALLALVNTTDEDLRNALAGAKTKGLAQDLNEAFGKTPQANLEKLKNAIGGLKVALVIGLSPAITDLSEAIQTMVRDKEIQEFFVDLGKLISDEVTPLVKGLVNGLKELIKFVGKNKVVLQSLVKVFIAFAGALGLIAVLAGVATLVVILSKAFTFLAVSVGLTNLGMLRLFGVVILGAIALTALKNAMGEMGKQGEEFNASLVGMNAGIGILSATILGFAVGGPLGALAAAVISTGFVIGTFLGKLTVDFIEGMREADAEARKFGFNNNLERQFSDFGEFLGLNFDPIIMGMRQAAVDAEIFFSKLLNPDLNAFGDLFDALFASLDFTKLAVIGEAIVNNIMFAISNTISNFSGFIDNIIGMFAAGDYSAIPQAIWDAIVNFFAANNPLAGVIETISSLMNGGQGGGGGMGADIASFFGEIFGGNSALQDTANELQAQLALQNEGQVEYFNKILESGLTLDEFAAAQREQLEAILPATETIDTLTATQGTKIVAEQDNIAKIQQNVAEVSRLNSTMPKVNNALDDVRKALKALFDAIASLTSKIRNTRIKIEKNDEGKIIGAKLTGAAAGDLNRLRTSFASGGIVRNPTNAVVGDVPGGEAIIPLSQLPGIIEKSMKGRGSGGDITINATISIDNSGGQLSASEISDQVIESLSSKLPKKIFLSNTT